MTILKSILPSLFICLISGLTVGQTAKKVLDINTGAPIESPRIFASNGNSLIITANTQPDYYPLNVDKAYLLGTDPNRPQELTIPDGVNWAPHNIDLEYIQFSTCQKPGWGVHNEDLFFYAISQDYGSANLLRYNASENELENIVSNVKPGTHDDMMSWNGKWILPTGRSIDTAATLIDQNTFERSFLVEPGAYVSSKNSIVFQNKLVLPFLKDNHIANEEGYFIYDPNGEEIFVDLLPHGLLDTVTGSSTSISYMPFATDSLLFFLQQYHSEHYTEVALYVSKGKAHDAQKLAIVYSENHHESNGAFFNADELVFHQNLIWKDGYLYFWAGQNRSVQEGTGIHRNAQLYKTDGTVAGTVIANTHSHMYLVENQKNQTMVQCGEDLFFTAQNSSTDTENNQELYKLNTETSEMQAVFSGPNIAKNLISINDTLMVFAEQIRNSGSNTRTYKHILYNSETGDTTNFFTHSTGGAASYYNHHALIDDVFYFSVRAEEFSPYPNYQLMALSVNGDSKTGIEEHHSKPTWTLAPNPAKDWLQIRADNFNQNQLQISITDLAGKTVLSQVQSVDAPIDVQSLSPGIYLLQLNEAGKSLGAQKFMVH